MKVINLRFRVPGLFLVKNRPNNAPSVNLILQGRLVGESEWKEAGEIEGFKFLGENYPGPIGVLSEPLDIITDPTFPRHDEGDGTKDFKILVDNSKAWEYRVIATPCVDCVRLWQSYGKSEDVIGAVTVIVAKGTIES